MKKIFLVLGGVVAAVFFVELAFRLAGLGLLWVWNREVPVPADGQIRVLCLGESTTMNQYPLMLEKVLNDAMPARTFSVIDRGMAGTNTGIIVQKLESYLDECQPHFVITMMGINDTGWEEGASAFDWFCCWGRDLRIVKLFRISDVVGIMRWVKRSLKTKLSQGLRRVSDNRSDAHPMMKVDEKRCLELGRANAARRNWKEAERWFRKVVELNPQSDVAHVELGIAFDMQRIWKEAEEEFRTAAELNSQNSRALMMLGNAYERRGDWELAESCFRKALEIEPKRSDAYLSLANSFWQRGDWDGAKRWYEKAIVVDPDNPQSYIAFGVARRSRDEWRAAEECFRKAIEVDPENGSSYVALGGIYSSLGDQEQALQLFKRAAQIDPDNVQAYIRVGLFYRTCGERDEAEKWFRNAMKIDPDNPFLKEQIVIIDRERRAGDPGHKQLSTGLGKALPRQGIPTEPGLRGPNYWSLTIGNYRKLRDILTRRKIKLICVEYPMRPVGPLKEALGNDPRVAFVDNERSFREGVAKDGYEDYFNDRFGGSFGHCTGKGNLLLARNIAASILAEVNNGTQKKEN